jgi:predicted acyl esterase
VKKPFLVAVFFALLAACTTSEPVAPKPWPFKVIEGVQELTVTGAAPRTPLTLYDPAGTKLLTLVTDAYGQAHFAYIPLAYTTIATGVDGVLPSYDGHTLRPGKGYYIRNDAAKPVLEAGPLRVLGVDDHPAVAHYEKQKIDKGLNYLEMRDGTLLSATVWLPDQAICGQGPWPTVVEYSGYDPSNPDSPQPGSMIANMLLCYATVGVNMRGTGCSGGVFDVFNPAQHADGYDIIEIVARQYFVLHHKVGMVGLSYPGISQLYVAYTNPPHLAAIAPQSVIDDPWRQAWPGGIYNSGFTKQWLEARDRYAKPSGESWVGKRIDGGDHTCRDNQQLRVQNVDFKTFSHSLSTYPPDAAERSLSLLVHRINVPVFLTGGWQDEQTGSRFATMLDEFTGAPYKRFTVYNGRHPDGYTPLNLTRWAEFLELYVARRIPHINAVLRVFDEPLLKEFFGPEGLHFEPDRFSNFRHYEDALAYYESEPSVRILFESGFGSAVTESPVARFERNFAAWPPPAEKGEWYLGPDGTLTAGAPAALATGDDGIDRYKHDPAAGDLSYIYSDSLYRLGWHWEPAGPGYALAYLTAPLAKNMLIAGNGGYAELWFASDATQANVEVSVLETRADGVENLIQNGVFNLRFRDAIDAAHSDDFDIEYTYAKEAVKPLVPKEFVKAKVPIRPFAHAFRAGSRLRIVIDTPGRDHGYWEFENPAYGDEVLQRVARTPTMPSKLVLPIIETGGDIPAPAPPCYSLRGVVCRHSFLALPNTTVTE